MFSVAINESGRRIGEGHHRAKLTDHEVTLVITLHFIEKWSYDRIRIKFDVSKSLIGQICRGERRCQTPAGYKVVHLKRRK